MTGPKTHDQQLRIIEKRENTANADKDFGPSTDLNTPKPVREAYQEKTHSPAARKKAETDNRSMLRGEHQESEHHKNRPDD
ncbi:hypothetical protein DUT91_06645 [Phyllobacterium salinisoli]|uniref:Uncharacterized protein n=1 Tax=Phyllobacterium salinisoli TaxID=1899321 RepID=A0A368K6X5_9HYPH|nr:hypothetical protein [Phyllobacterium salinisoli]RCS25099.1 hypothetical protein DUT91_06645 [Phyllobacterium salinisoli]